MIDLHLHTTASDGLYGPEELVDRARRAGITILSVTDHDTMAATGEAKACAVQAGLGFVPGIEITAVHNGTDVHVLGYFLHAGHPGLRHFLAVQRRDRRRRVETMGMRLAALGVPIAMEAILGPAPDSSERSVGRQQVARALLEAGHVRTIQEAFDRFIGEDGPAYVARRGASPPDVFGMIKEAGGVPSLAHPGLLRQDGLIAGWASAGLEALEVCHSDHDAATEAHYRRLAAACHLAVSGGSDYHGDVTRRRAAFGAAGVTPAELDALRARAPAGSRPARSSAG